MPPTRSMNALDGSVLVVERPVRIWLVRHGETDWNLCHRFQGRSDVPLNERGRAQAMALAAALKEECLVAIHTSPLVRALETARVIGSLHPRAPICIEEDLAEMDLGEFEGMEAREWASHYPDILRRWLQDPSTVRMPGGEDLHEVQARAWAAVERICSHYQRGSTILLCGHNFVNLAILCRVMEVPLARFRDLRQGTAALNLLLREGTRTWVEFYDHRSHLIHVPEQGRQTASDGGEGKGL